MQAQIPCWACFTSFLVFRFAPGTKVPSLIMFLGRTTTPSTTDALVRPRGAPCDTKCLRVQHFKQRMFDTQSFKQSSTFQTELNVSSRPRVSKHSELYVSNRGLGSLGKNPKRPRPERVGAGLLRRRVARADGALEGEGLPTINSIR